MTNIRSLYLLLVNYGVLILSQRLGGTQMYIGSPGLSESCRLALNTEISCPNALAVISTKNTILDAEQAQALCVDTCHDSLEDAKRAIERACTATTDVIVHNNAEYRATYIVDNFLYTYDLSCTRDRKTGALCDPQFFAWPSQKNLSPAQKYCSDCWLGVQALQLSEPLGYDEGLASNFASLTSSCQATGYSFKTPSPYPTSIALKSSKVPISGLSASSVESGIAALSTSICQHSYEVNSTDDCNAVAKANNVSTYDLLQANDLDLYCYNFKNFVGKTLCIPSTCDTYTWRAHDSCESVVQEFPDISVTQFLSWNPNFNLLCQNSHNFVDYEVCVSPPGGNVPTRSGEKLTKSTAISSTSSKRD